MTLALFFQLFVNALAMGLLYVLIVLGIDVIMRVTNLVNFAHGQFFMVGAYVFFYSFMSLQLHFVLGLVLAGVALFIVGGICYALIFYRVQRDFKPGQNFIYQMTMSAMASLGLMMVLSQGALLIFGSTSKTIPTIFEQILRVGGVNLPLEKLIVIGAGVMVLVALYFLMYRTKLGLGMRAVSIDTEVASLHGINSFWICVLGFGLGCALAGFAGGIMAPMMAVTTDMGNSVIFSAFMIMIVGGMGSYKGTIVGGLVVGLVLSYGIYFFGGLTELFLFVAVIVFIMFRPEGFFGEVFD
jgi:branched-chain amino acid transport system permease protein